MGLIDLTRAGLAKVGSDVLIYDFTRLTDPAHISIGDHVIVDDFVFLQGGLGLRIGSYVHISSFASITGGGVGDVGNFCCVSTGARVLTGSDRFDGSGLIGSTVPTSMRSVDRSFVMIGDHAFVGANAVVNPGVRIGAGAVVGSGAVVIEDLEPWTINVGVPTRVVGQRPSAVILGHARELGFSGE